MRSALLALLFAAATALPAFAAQPIRVVNIMPSFFSVWPPRRLAASDRVKEFKEKVIYPNGALYNRSFFALDDPHIAWYLARIGPQIGKLRAFSASLNDALVRQESTFEASFPKFDPATVQIYLMPSMNTFDGMTVDVNGKHGLLIGIDTLANENLNSGVFVDHELFHIYHHEINPSFFASAPGEDDLYHFGLYRQLWAEGLATYVSQQLNPTATNADALASPALAKLSEADTQKLACIAYDNLDSVEDGYSALLFDAVTHPKGLPPRGGYLIGYLAAKKLNERMSLSDLTDLQGSALRAHLGAVTSSLCGRRSDRGAASVR